jgi:hypothetical protein
LEFEIECTLMKKSLLCIIQLKKLNVPKFDANMFRFSMLGDKTLKLQGDENVDDLGLQQNSHA